MKSRTLLCITAIALFAALAIPVSLAAQEDPEGVTRANNGPANPVPLINQPLVPDANPSLGGGTSNVVFFEVTPPSSSITISAPSTFDTKTGPGSVAVGDFNGDGKRDLVVGNVFSDTVSVLLGEGDGTFQAAVDYGTEISPSSVDVGDFNGDGRLDLVVTNSCGSDPASGIGQEKCGGSCSGGHPCASGCKCAFGGHCVAIVYSGYCEIDDSTGKLLTDGLCVSHRYNFCYIQPSANCPKGKPAINPTDTTCGSFGIARIDLARKCSF